MLVKSNLLKLFVASWTTTTSRLSLIGSDMNDLRRLRYCFELEDEFLGFRVVFYFILDSAYILFRLYNTLNGIK